MYIIAGATHLHDGWLHRFVHSSITTDMGFLKNSCLFFTDMMSSNIALKCTYVSFFLSVKVTFGLLPLGVSAILLCGTIFLKSRHSVVYLRGPAGLKIPSGARSSFYPAGVPGPRPQALACAYAHRVRLTLGGVGSLPLSVRGLDQAPQHC